MPTGKFNAFTIGQVVARLMPEETIISDDGATSSLGVVGGSANARPHDHLALTGGSIGQGMPLAVGCAIACPDRKVLSLSGDGSAMYTLQALWTQAREKLDVTTIVFANRAYKILGVELARVGAGEAGPKAREMISLDDPALDWVRLAQGMGVEASRAETLEAFADQFASAMNGKGPRLIEVVIA
jgi:acetolactate synthase-1/2/3 large subunit